MIVEQLYCKECAKAHRLRSNAIDGDVELPQLLQTKPVMYARASFRAQATQIWKLRVAGGEYQYDDAGT
jgi:hypothetical protein